MARNDQRNQQGQGQGGTAVAKKEDTQAQIQAIRSYLEKASSRVQDVLPGHLTPERMLTVATTLCYRTPKLLKCDRLSLLSAVIRAASLGLDLEAASCEAYLIPRWNGTARVNECHFQIGFQGLRKLALQSGQIRYIVTRLVHQNDHFEYGFDPELRFQHRPFRGAAKGPVVEVYSHAKLTSGDDLIEVMTVDEIRAIEVRARAPYRRDDGTYPSSPWDTDWNEMARKTVLRRHCKSLPRSIDLDRALAFDAEVYADAAPTVVSASPGRSRLGHHQNRGLAALHARAGSDGAMDFGPMPEGETTFEPGTARPLYSEPEPPDAVPDDDPSGFGPGRQPGDD